MLMQHMLVLAQWLLPTATVEQQQGFGIFVSPCRGGGSGSGGSSKNQTFVLAANGQLQWQGHDSAELLCADGTCSNPLAEKCTPIPLRACDRAAAATKWQLDGQTSELHTTSQPVVCLDLWNGGKPPYSAVGLYVCDEASGHPNQRWRVDVKNRRIVSADTDVRSPLCLTAMVTVLPPPAPPPPPPMPAQVFRLVSTRLVPTATFDLASTSAWNFAIRRGWQPPPSAMSLSAQQGTVASAWRRIIVPGGGFNSDLQELPFISALVGDSTLTQLEVEFNSTSAAEYQRELPSSAIQLLRRHASTVLLEFGSVNYGALIFIEGGGKPRRLIGAHYGPMMPFGVKLPMLSNSVDSLTLIVQVLPYERFPGIPSCFVYPDSWRTFGDSRGAWGGCKTTGCRSRFAMGIARSVRLAVYPEIHIADARVWTSVTNRTLRFAVTIRNDGGAARSVVVSSVLSSWATDKLWSYPRLPQLLAVVRAGQTATVTTTVPWELNESSYWWPNKPFNENYVATLHWLNLTLHSQDRPHTSALAPTLLPVNHDYTHRFGFVEWRDDLVSGKWSVNGVGINFISDATPESGMSHYDCYTTSAAFNTIEGAKETWRRYMRLGISSNRIHQSTPTEIMMAAADEVGFTMRPETGLRGGGAHDPDQQFDQQLSTQSVQELAHACRGHPSIASYSLLNECSVTWVPALIDAISDIDDATPLVWENSGGCKQFMIHGKNNSARHARCMSHYDMPILPQPGQITGEGECAWCSYHGIGLQGEMGTVERLSMLAWQGRVHGLNYISGWDWINYWPNFLHNMSYARHAFKQPECPDTAKDRVDGITGWGSPLIDWVRRAFHPYLIVLLDDWEQNPSFTPAWPRLARSGTSGQLFHSRAVLLNDGVAATRGDEFIFRWSLRWDSASGPPPVGSAPVSTALTIRRGYSVSHNFSVTLPNSAEVSMGNRSVFLILELIKDGVTLFTENRIKVYVVKNGK
jgi:hypothetical protein